jgi:hypothetical protein
MLSSVLRSARAVSRAGGMTGKVKKDARRYTATTQAEEDAHGRILAAKRGEPPPPATETVRKWSERWIASFEFSRALDRLHAALLEVEAIGPACARQLDAQASQGEP